MLRNLIKDLPVEIAQEVLTKMSPEEMARLGITIHEFADVKKQLMNQVWQKNFERHFPHRFRNMQSHDNIVWFTEFKKAYRDEYRGIDARSRKFIALIKEGDVSSVKDFMSSNRLSHEHFGAIIDLGYVTPLFRSANIGNQALLDYIYSLAVGQYSDPQFANSQVYSLLHWAVICNQPYDQIVSLTKVGININQSSNKCPTPVCLAARYGHLELMKKLIENGADINQVAGYDESPISEAVRFGRLDVVRELIKRNVSINPANKDGENTLLIAAAANGDLAMVDLLLANGAKVTGDHRQKRVLDRDYMGYDFSKIQPTHGTTPLNIAAEKSYWHIVIRFLNESNMPLYVYPEGGHPLLCCAAEAGRQDVVNKILTYAKPVSLFSPDHDQYGIQKALYIAAKNAHLDVLRELLRVQNIREAINFPGNQSPLLVAAEKGHAGVVKELLTMRDISIDMLDSDWHTPLHLAATNGYVDVMRILLQAGADVNAVDKYGQTPLQLAIMNESVSAVTELLKDPKLDVNMVNKAGMTALEIASVTRQPNISRAINARMLSDYCRQIQSAPENYHKKSFALFGHKFDFGYSAAEKKLAAQALKDVIEGKKDKSTLEGHKGALNNGELGEIYRRFFR